MTINVKNSPAPRMLNTTSTHAPAKSTPTAKSDAANGATGASPSPQVQPQKPPASAPPGYHQDQLGKPKAPSQAPTGHGGVFQSQKDVATLNSRRGTVFSTRPSQGGPSGPASSAQPKQLEQLQTSAHLSNRGASKAEQDCNALAQKHGAACTTKIFQSDKLNSVATQEFPGARNGVCIAMSSEWIRSNIQDAKTGTNDHSQLFHTLAENGGRPEVNAHFVNLQHENLAAISHINDLINKKNTALADLVDTNERFKQPPPPKWKAWAAPHPTEAEVLQKLDTANAAQAAYSQAKQNELNRLVGGVSHGSAGTAAKINELENNFAGQFPQNGFHQVSIFRADGSGGHDLAVQMGDKPRLLDPNTGEWKFESKQQMNDFMKDYMKTMYPSYSSGNFESTHYPS
ncbi:YopT-type cysteine protease domain-containing protein [Cystobacter ferrugineus]|uniref:Peptidase C58 YopT-type domain-containing protein n=1 Tax=Cystobacter ferrugineus TaxID=83449 RepID=A0A1L9AY53_9BACT|nr:YopT-type cysteine protease domain-containing protein [Cystobacter ferrugineus]OJH34941.1 hypothetical protein BON30_40880 [Cystobacter ferrugineus]